MLTFYISTITTTEKKIIEKKNQMTMGIFLLFLIHIHLVAVACLVSKQANTLFLSGYVHLVNRVQRCLARMATAEIKPELCLFVETNVQTMECML